VAGGSGVAGGGTGSLHSVATGQVTVQGSAGTANTGGGGGGGGTTANADARLSGGSGIVIVRYLGTTKATGGTITEITVP
jgi:hypothetical protein